jgi:hypothetical protein
VRTYAVPAAYDLEHQGDKQMGRPIKKSFFGVSTGSQNAGILLNAFIPAAGAAGYVSGTGGSSAVESYIVRQVGSKKYIVSNAQGVGRIELVNDSTPVAGEGYLLGYNNFSPVAIKKLTAKLAVDFDDNRYTWSLENDSTADVIRLQPL